MDKSTNIHNYQRAEKLCPPIHLKTLRIKFPNAPNLNFFNTNAKKQINLLKNTTYQYSICIYNKYKQDNKDRKHV